MAKAVEQQCTKSTAQQRQQICSTLLSSNAREDKSFRCTGERQG
jgi:hypothetical protein